MYDGSRRGFFSVTTYQIIGEQNAFHKRRQPYPLVKVKERYDLLLGTLGFPKYKSWSRRLTAMVGWLRDCGVVRGLFGRYEPYAEMEERGDGVREGALQLDHFFAPMLILAVALALSGAVFGGELFAGRNLGHSSLKLQRMKLSGTRFLYTLC